VDAGSPGPLTFVHGVGDPPPDMILTAHPLIPVFCEAVGSFSIVGKRVLLRDLRDGYLNNNRCALRTPRTWTGGNCQQMICISVAPEATGGCI
jgi:hypothetical protein